MTRLDLLEAYQNVNKKKEHSPKSTFEAIGNVSGGENFETMKDWKSRRLN